MTNDDDTTFQVAFGQAVRSLRETRRLTQEQFGMRAGMHRNYIGAVERGENNLTLKLISRLARGANVERSVLFRMAEEIQRAGHIASPPAS